MWRRIGLLKKTDVSEDRAQHFLAPLISSTLKIEATRSTETSVLKSPRYATWQKTALFIVTAVKTSNPTLLLLLVVLLLLKNAVFWDVAEYGPFKNPTFRKNVPNTSYIITIIVQNKGPFPPE
jgi:hypothetical protein